MKTGTIATTAAAELPPQSIETVPTNEETPMGMVRVSRPDSTRANRNSFQENSMVKIAAETNPGAVSGSAIRQKAPIREQPSILAASSSSTGISSKKLRIIQMTNGKLNVVCAMMIAQ